MKKAVKKRCKCEICFKAFYVRYFKASGKRVEFKEGYSFQDKWFCPNCWKDIIKYIDAVKGCKGV